VIVMSALIASLAGVVLSLAFTLLAVVQPAAAAAATALLLVGAAGLYGYAHVHHPDKRRRR